MDAVFRSYSFGIAAFCFLLAFLFVPFRELKRWTPFALVAGVLPALALFFIGGPLLAWWRFHDPVLLFGLPVMLVLAWYPVEVLFAHGLDILALTRRRAALVFLVAFVSMQTYVYLRAHGVWEEKVPFRESRVFLFAFILHGLFAFYLGRRREKKEARSALPPLI
ncbi:MAG: hypothetical protein GX493_09620 [Firmicutes bacterium]|nr:hypothetical protein [Bacillota bacterium]